jgi:hypothetical protein
MLAGSYFVFYLTLSVVMPGQHSKVRAPVAAPAPSAGMSVAQRQAKLDDDLARLMTTLDCTPPSAWRTLRPHEFPTSMIVKPAGTFRLVVSRWQYPPRPGVWVLALCRVNA